MTYILRIGPWHVGPFPTHISAQHFAESHGCDDYTLIPHRNKAAADGPRYKSLGNSMAVPVMRWIGERIQMVENITKKN